MNYKKIVKDALSSLNVPVCFQTYTGTALTYITFFCYTETNEEYAENNPIATGYYVQVDIWSKTECDTLAESVKTALQNTGFKGYTAQDLYESDTKVHHKAIRINYIT